MLTAGSLFCWLTFKQLIQLVSSGCSHISSLFPAMCCLLTQLRAVRNRRRRRRQQCLRTLLIITNDESKDHVMKTRFNLRRKCRRSVCSLCHSLLRKYQSCLLSLKREILPARSSPMKKSTRSKLHPLPDRPIRRAASRLSRRSMNDLGRMLRKGDDWTANDLFRFQYGSMKGFTNEEKKAICEEWIRRLSVISKKFCYLAWYASALYTCYYRIAPLITNLDEKRMLWSSVKREYAEILLMGRRIWKRPTHPSRLRVVYDLATLCIRFNDIQDDETIILFRDLLSDENNFNYKMLGDLEYAKSIEKVIHLENHTIDLFFVRRCSSTSARSSFRSRSSIDAPRGGSVRVKRVASQREEIELDEANIPNEILRRDKKKDMDSAPHSAPLFSPLNLEASQSASLHVVPAMESVSAPQSPRCRPRTPTSPKLSVRFAGDGASDSHLQQADEVSAFLADRSELRSSKSELKAVCDTSVDSETSAQSMFNLNNLLVSIEETVVPQAVSASQIDRNNEGYEK